jgi:hypothetical protein
MIIFDLDGSLACCEHRRHFVDPEKNPNVYLHEDKWLYLDDYSYPKSRVRWKPDWSAFYEACDKDMPIEPVIEVFRRLMRFHVEIWSGRCESTRDKTMKWIQKNICYGTYVEHTRNEVKLFDACDIPLKMRPEGDNTPDDELKEKWLDERILYQYCNLCYGSIDMNCPCKKSAVDFVFDDRKKVRDMWQRRGIFVFDVNQNPGKEF